MQDYLCIFTACSHMDDTCTPPSAENKCYFSCRLCFFGTYPSRHKALILTLWFHGAGIQADHLQPAAQKRILQPEVSRFPRPPPPSSDADSDCGKSSCLFPCNLRKTFSLDVARAFSILSKLLDDDAISTQTQSEAFVFYWPSCYVTNRSLCSRDDR